MNVFLRELQAYRKSTIIWAASLTAILVFYMALYPAFTKDVAATRQIFSSFPEAVRTALNISLGNFFTIYGFFGYLLSFATLAGAIQAMNLGTGIISKEVSSKTADFLLSKPVARSGVVSAKLAAALLLLVLTNVVFMTMSYLAASVAVEGSFSAEKFLLVASTLFLVQLIFLALGALFATIIPKVKSVVSVTLPTVFAFYIAGTLGDILDNDNVRYVSPFEFFDTNYIIDHTRLETRFLLIEAAIIAVAIALTYVIYIKKDVRASI